MPVRVQRDDPYAAHSFQIEIDGISQAGGSVVGSFSEVSGLDVEIAPIEYRNGSEPTVMRKIPGLRKYPNIVLKRGIIADVTFWDWLVATMNGDLDEKKTVKRFKGRVTLLNEKREPVMIWRFNRAWPCKYTGPSLNAKNNEIALESLEICHEGLTIDGGKLPAGTGE